MKKVTEMAILISSCDKYQDVWSPFFSFFFKYWEDCPYNIYLLTNHLKFEHPKVKSICVGDDRDWSSSFRKAINSIDEQYLMVLIEDYFLLNDVNTDVINDFFNYMLEREVDYFRLFPCPGPGKITDNIGSHKIGTIASGEPYRTSLQAAIWNKELIDKILVDGESAWEFEVDGSKRSDGMADKFMSISRESIKRLPFNYFCTAVVKGRWVKKAIELCRRHGVSVDLNSRPIETWFHRLKQNVGNVFILGGLIRFFKKILK